MEISKATVGVLVAACLIVGAGGAYLSLRTSEPAPAAVGAAAPVSPPPPAATAEDREPIPEESAIAEGTAQFINRHRPPSSAERRPAPPPAGVAHQVQIENVLPESAPALDMLPLSAVRMDVRSGAAPVAEPVRLPEPEPIRALESSSPEFEELVVSEDSVVGLQMETSITSEGSRVEDKVVARVTRDVRVGDRIVIPAGAEVHGEVTLVERGGRLRDRARLGVRFTLIVLADGTRIPLETEAIYREGDAREEESAARIGGGALGGAIIGGIFGRMRGAVIGGSVGAGAGTATVLAGGRDPAAFRRGMPITVRVTAPTIVILERE